MTSFIAIMLIWVVLYLILMMQYYYPLSLYAPNDSPIMTLKRCNEFFLANIKWSFILLLKNIVSLAISIISGMIIPGLTGISVSRMVMTRLIIVFYEYLEANPNETKKSVNIEDALFKEKESVGNRSFWEMIFPWKSEQ